MYAHTQLKEKTSDAQLLFALTWNLCSSLGFQWFYSAFLLFPGFGEGVSVFGIFFNLIR